MKKIFLASTFLFIWFWLMGIIRYREALQATQRTDGSDTSIEITMHQYGFDLAWYEQPTITDFIKAPFK